MEKPRRVRIYKLSTFDSYTEEERKLHNIYKGREPGTKTIAGKKQDRDEKIAAFQGVRKIEITKTGKSEEKMTNWERDSTDKEIALFESQFARIPLVLILHRFRTQIQLFNIAYNRFSS